jgi:hypothetical protein
VPGIAHVSVGGDDEADPRHRGASKDNGRPRGYDKNDDGRPRGDSYSRPKHDGALGAHVGPDGIDVHVSGLLHSRAFDLTFIAAGQRL